MGAKRSKKAKEKRDGAGRGTGKARNSGALSTVRPVKSQEEEGGLFGVGSLLSMMWRHKERGAVSIGGQNSTDPVLSLGLICSTVSHLCPEVSWVERGSWNNLRQAGRQTVCIQITTSLPGSRCFSQGQTGSWLLRTTALLRLSSSSGSESPSGVV